jgi:hypothetical protein
LATGGCRARLQRISGGLPTRRRLTTCPTTSAEFPSVGKVCGIGAKLDPASLRRMLPANQAAHLHPAKALRAANRPGGQTGSTWLAGAHRFNASTSDSIWIGFDT